jgi:hypothetical protein
MAPVVIPPISIGGGGGGGISLGGGFNLSGLGSILGVFGQGRGGVGAIGPGGPGGAGPGAGAGFDIHANLLPWLGAVSNLL